MRRGRFIAGVAAATAGAGARARAQIIPGQPIQPQQQFLPQFNIAVNVTLSGSLQKYGQEVVKGVQAAVDETNRFNAPVSHVWGLRPLDDRNDPGVAASNVNVAGADFSVIGAIGSLTSAMTLAALPRYAQQGLAVIVPTVTADAVTKRGFHNVYRLPAKDSSAGRLFASTALEGKRGVSAIAVAFDGDYGYDVARGFVDQAKADGHPADMLLFPFARTDPAAAARTVLDRAPGFVFLAGKTAELGPVADAMRLARYAGDFGASDGFFNLDTITSYATTLQGAYVASALPPLDKIPSAIQLVTDFQREVSQITAFSAYGYASAQLIFAAVQRANATSKFGLLHSLQSGGTFTTLVGQFAFNISGDPLIPNIFLYTITKDGFKYARPAVRTGFIL
ncbi:MAG: branched-chain amino acid ABC transporter substrate-binding protein [Candidatus Eremiobacteraeota bacterium]|nr:branched-chain amino acid ABC transporter substrate-binding protein [Candidatus Eremiobacteraeota bacterium]MBV8498964.1 branched-chain amino acid ABC transporter substrate-binding protein [Candidatus Eremiobacteraeota bacterium]